MTAAATLVGRARSSRRLSMGALADLAGVPKSTISRVESGQMDPTVGMLGRLIEAAGFRLGTELAGAGSDEPFARLIGRLERADPVERDRLLARFPAVAATAPIAERTGGRRTETPGGIAQTMTMLARQGQAPVVSGAEAVARSFESGHSFIPVIYVSDPASVTGLEPARLSSRRVMFLLPVTDNVTACSRDLGRFRGVCPEWGVLDTLASPGRQAEFGLDMLAELRGAAR